MVALERKPRHRSVIRELAMNLDRVTAGQPEHVCLAPREGEPSCACYLNARHEGWHHCLCSAEWPADAEIAIKRA
jgi:hypothetical protein